MKLAVSILGLVTVLAYAALGALQILVLNPLAAVPGRSLPEIHHDLEGAGESFGVPLVIAVFALGAALAILLFVLVVARRDIGPSAAAVAFLAMLVFGAPAFFVASFGPGMALADTYSVSGGDHAPGGWILALVSAVAMLGLLAILVTDALARRRARAATA